MRPENRVKISLGLLLLLGFASVVLYRAGVRAEGVRDIQWFIKVALVQAVLYVAAVWIIFRAQSSRSTLLVVLGFAVLFRLSIVFSPPYLSDDVYRYVWDGRVQAAGINPYRYVPSSPELAHLRDESIYPKINRRDSPTIYPPLAEALFFFTTRISESVVWMKLTIVGFEGLAIWAMAQLLASFGIPRQRLLIYAWHPLVVWEFASSGHVDAVAVALIFLALLAWRRNANAGTGIALAGATLVKVFPLVLFPAVLSRKRWVVALVFVAAIVVAYLPYVSVGPMAMLGYLPGYAREQGLVSGQQFYLLSLARKVFGIELSSMVYVVATGFIMGGLAIWAMLRNERDQNNLKPALVLATAATVLFAPHYSWYFAWLVPFLCFTPSIAVFYLTIASFVLYRTWLGDSANEMFWMNSIIYLPFVLFGIVEVLWRRIGFDEGALVIKSYKAVNITR